MASTYSDLKIELIGTGEQAGTWGVTTNTNLGTALQEAITGSADVAFSSGDVTLTLTNSNAAQVGRNLRLNLTGTSGGARELILGSGMQVEKFYLINNNLADTVTVKNTAGTGIAVPAGKSTFVFNDGTNVVDAITFLSSLQLAGDITMPSAGAIDDPNGNELIKFPSTVASAVNEITVANAATGSPPKVEATGGDTNIGLNLISKGTGEVFTANFMSGVFSDRVVALGNLGSATTLNASQGTVYTATLDQSSTLTLGTTNGTANRATSFTLILTNGAGGPFTLTLAGGTFKYSDGTISRTTTAAAVDVWFFFTPDGGTTFFVSIPIKNATT